MLDQFLQVTSKFKHWQEMPDAEIWKRFKAGDYEALEYIYRAYTKDLFNFGMKIKSNSCLVEDAIQELFVELWNARRNIADTRKIKFYLLKALRWKITYLLKREQKLYATQVPKEVPEVDIILPYESRLVNDQASQEKKAHLYACINQLPQRQKEILQLLFFEDLSYEEIAGIMHIHKKSVYVLASRALSSLRKNLTRPGVRLLMHGAIFLWALLQISCLL